MKIFKTLWLSRDDLAATFGANKSSKRPRCYPRVRVSKFSRVSRVSIQESLRELF
jgi:hypothetical protein